MNKHYHFIAHRSFPTITFLTITFLTITFPRAQTINYLIIIIIIIIIIASHRIAYVVKKVLIHSVMTAAIRSITCKLLDFRHEKVQNDKR